MQTLDLLLRKRKVGNVVHSGVNYFNSVFFYICCFFLTIKKDVSLSYSFFSTVSATHHHFILFLFHCCCFFFVMLYSYIYIFFRALYGLNTFVVLPKVKR